jgi:hypothetical protein
VPFLQPFVVQVRYRIVLNRQQGPPIVHSPLAKLLWGEKMRKMPVALTDNGLVRGLEAVQGTTTTHTSFWRWVGGLQLVGQLDQ